MLAVMFWGDDEQKQKTRVEEKLRKKKEERRGERAKQPVPTHEPSDSGNAEELAHQTELIGAQQRELVDLKHLLVQQGKVLQQILEKKETHTVESIRYVEKETREGGDDLPSLQEINVDVIHTEGIETTGEAGEEATEGKSVKDRASKLRALIQRGKE
jgi:hypothetical protein